MNTRASSRTATMPLMEGYESAREAATRLGYDYTFFTRKLNRGEIPGAKKFQQVWIVPTDVTREQVERPIGRPRREKE